MRRRIRVSQWPHTIWVRLMNGALVMCSSSARISAEPIFSSQSLFGPFVNIIGQQSFYEVPTTHTGTSHYSPQRGIYILPVRSPSSLVCPRSYPPTMSLPILPQYSLSHYPHKGLSNINAGVTVLATAFVSC